MRMLVYSLLALLASAVFATLFYAFQITGDAGPGRLIQKYPRARRRVSRWERRWGVLQATLLLCSTLAQVGAVLLAANVLGRHGDTGTAAFLLLVALVVVLFAFLVDILPRVFSESYADRLSVFALPVVGALSLLLFVLAWPLAWLERRLLARLLREAPAGDRPTAEEEIRSLVEQTEDNPLEEEEREIIRSVFEFGSTVAREIMTPRVDIEALEADRPVAEVVPRVRESGYSRYPVYEETIDHVIGFVHAKDLLPALQNGAAATHLRGLVQEEVFVPETMPISDLLQLLRTRRVQLAVVVDEYGGTAGLVTMEDILEELIGEIRDEYDRDEVDVPPPRGNAAVFDAATAVDEINEAMGIALPDEAHYDSIAGYIVSELGRIPAPGETLERPGALLTVEESNERRILKVRVERTTGPGEEPREPIEPGPGAAEEPLPD